MNRRYDLNQVRRIAERASDLYARNGVSRDQINFAMDIELCEARLDLDALERFADPDFLHDLAGIAQHLDHDTGELRDCFAPRCAARMLTGDNSGGM